MKYSVAIVEDHKLLSQAIAGIVDLFINFKVSMICNNGEELTKKINSANIPEIVLMDVNMPIMNGVETTSWLTQNYPECKVLALTVEEDELTILKMIKAGAKGYLLKDVDKQTLEQALEITMNTGFYHSELINNALLSSVTGKSTDDNGLKETEIQFLRLLCSEMTYKEIADKMNLSPKTIDGYRDSLFAKLNVKNRIGLVIYAVKNKIFSI